MPGFNPDQPRDEKGQWTDTGAGAAIKTAAGGNVVYNPETGERYIEEEKKETPKVVTNAAEASRALNEMIEKGIINEDHVYAVGKYTGADYQEINQPLRQGRSPEEIVHARVIKALDEFLQIAPKYNGISYRGIRFMNESAFESFLSDLQDDSILEDEAFGSTTIEKTNIKIFSISGMARYSVEMTVKGKSGVYVDPISSMQTEQEVIFPRLTKFKVKNLEIEDLTDKTGVGNLMKKAKVELEEVN